MPGGGGWIYPLTTGWMIGARQTQSERYMVHMDIVMAAYDQEHVMLIPSNSPSIKIKRPWQTDKCLRDDENGRRAGRGHTKHVEDISKPEREAKIILMPSLEFCRMLQLRDE